MLAADGRAPAESRADPQANTDFTTLVKSVDISDLNPGHTCARVPDAPPRRCRRQRHAADHLQGRLGRAPRPDLLRLRRHHVRGRRRLRPPHHPLLQRDRARRGRQGRRRRVRGPGRGLVDRLGLVGRLRRLGAVSWRRGRSRGRLAGRRVRTCRPVAPRVPLQTEEEVQAAAGSYGGKCARGTAAARSGLVVETRCAWRVQLSRALHITSNYLMLR